MNEGVLACLNAINSCRRSALQYKHTQFEFSSREKKKIVNNMSLIVRKPVFGVSDQVPDTNRAVQPQKMA